MNYRKHIGKQLVKPRFERIITMRLDDKITCPKCSGTHFTAKYESTYVYSYTIGDSDHLRSNAESHTLPFMFDDREQKDAVQYIECENCRAKFPCEFTLGSEHVDFTIIQKAVRANYAKDIEFWG